MFKQFVKNRVKEIRDKMPTENIGDTARARTTRPTYPLGASAEFFETVQQMVERTRVVGGAEKELAQL